MGVRVVTDFLTDACGRMRVGVLAAAAVLATGVPWIGTASAADPMHAGQISAYFDEHVAPWVTSELIVNTLRNQNAQTRRLERDEVRALDDAWRQEVGTDGIERPMVEEVMARPISLFLQERQQEADWMIVEIILMDARGLNAGLSVPSSDYWQGDEAKFMNTFALASHEPTIDVIEFEAETGLLISQVSNTIFDPDTGKAIGAITVAVNMNKL